MKKTKNTKSGFLVAEVLVASAIIVVAVLSAMSVAQKSIYVSSQSLNMAKAGSLLEEGAEVMRILRDDDWGNIASLSQQGTYYPVFAGSTWSLTLAPLAVGGFTRTVTVTDVTRDASTLDIDDSGSVDDPGTKLITVEVTWLEGGAELSRNLSFYLSDIFNE